MEPEQGNRQITAPNSICNLAKDSYFRQAPSTAGPPASPYYHGRGGFLTGTAPVDGAVKKVIPTSFTACIIYQSHYLRSAGHLKEAYMYDCMQRKYGWPHMAKELYTAVRNCSECARTDHQIKINAFYKYLLEVAH